MKLVDKNGVEVQNGAKLTSFRGESYTLISSSKPHKPSSSGRVYVEAEDGFKSEFYPSVFDLKFVA